MGNLRSLASSFDDIRAVDGVASGKRVGWEHQTSHCLLVSRDFDDLADYVTSLLGFD